MPILVLVCDVKIIERFEFSQLGNARHRLRDLPFTGIKESSTRSLRSVTSTYVAPPSLMIAKTAGERQVER